MANAADVVFREKELDGLVAAGQFEYFFDRMLDFATEFGTRDDRNEALVRCGSFSDIVRQLRKQTITESDFKVQRAKCVSDALNHKDDIYEAVILRSPPVVVVVPPQVPNGPVPGGTS